MVGMSVLLSSLASIMLLLILHSQKPNTKGANDDISYLACHRQETDQSGRQDDKRYLNGHPYRLNRYPTSIQLRARIVPLFPWTSVVVSYSNDEYGADTPDDCEANYAACSQEVTFCPGEADDEKSSRALRGAYRCDIEYL